MFHDYMKYYLNISFLALKYSIQAMEKRIIIIPCGKLVSVTAFKIPIIIPIDDDTYIAYRPNFFRFSNATAVPINSTPTRMAAKI